MIRSLYNLVATGIGFNTARLATLDISLPQTRYPDGASQSRFFRTVMDRLRGAPGITAVAVVDNLPLHSVSVSNFYIAGRPDPPMESLPMSDLAHVSPQYFSMIGLRLHAGRFFTDADLARAEKDQNSVAIVNQSFAARFFIGEDPLGKRLLSADKKHVSEIVGVVADYRPTGVEKGTRPQIFWPYLMLANATIIARTAAAPQSFTKAIQNAVWSVDKDLPANKVLTMEYYMDEWQAQRKFNTLLLVVFAGLALALAMMGVYGVLSNLVASRVREIGIRMAIGAKPWEIGTLMLRQSTLPIALGLAAGLAASIAVSWFVEALLFQVRARDPLTLALAVSAILLVSPVAIFAPVRRAVTVDCTVALREE